MASKRGAYFAISDLALSRILRNLLINSGRISERLQRWLETHPDVNELPGQVTWMAEYEARVAMSLLREQREREKMAPATQVLSEDDYQLALRELEAEVLGKMSRERLLELAEVAK